MGHNNISTTTWANSHGSRAPSFAKAEIQNRNWPHRSSKTFANWHQRRTHLAASNRRILAICAEGSRYQVRHFPADSTASAAISQKPSPLSSTLHLAKRRSPSDSPASAPSPPPQPHTRRRPIGLLPLRRGDYQVRPQNSTQAGWHVAAL